MKFYLSILIACLSLAFTGCKSPEQGAYRTIGSIAQTVDVAMKTYGDLYRAGLVTTDDQVRVRAAYSSYQATMKIARAVVFTAKDSPENQSAYITAIDSVAAASGELIALIHQLKQ